MKGDDNVALNLDNIFIAPHAVERFAIRNGLQYSIAIHNIRNALKRSKEINKKDVLFIFPHYEEGKKHNKEKQYYYLYYDEVMKENALFIGNNRCIKTYITESTIQLRQIQKEKSSY